MQFDYFGKTWLKDGFHFPSLFEYLEDTKKKLAQPLLVPPYATAGEVERLQGLSEKRKKNPYLSRAQFNESVKNLSNSFSNVRSISFGDNPMLYDVCIFAASKLMKMSPLIFLYTTEDAGYRYNAFAIDNQDKVWIYLSNQLFSEHGMLNETELCYLIGHELGHAQCHHSTITTVQSGKNSDKEFSADRAGMIACAGWLREKHPEYPLEKVIELSVLYAASTLEKLGMGFKNGPGKTKWAAFDYDSLRETIHDAFKGASKLTISQGTHPHDRHRIMAMLYFSQSQLFYRCLGLDAENYKDLYTDQQLQRIMAPILVNE